MICVAAPRSLGHQRPRADRRRLDVRRRDDRALGARCCSRRAILTIGNTILKPILAILTLPLIIVTFGLAYFALNVLMLALAEWIAPDFSIDGFWTYVGATIVVWLVNVSVGWLLDRVRG